MTHTHTHEVFNTIVLEIFVRVCRLYFPQSRGCVMSQLLASPNPVEPSRGSAT